MRRRVAAVVAAVAACVAFASANSVSSGDGDGVLAAPYGTPQDSRSLRRNRRTSAHKRVSPAQLKPYDPLAAHLLPLSGDQRAIEFGDAISTAVAAAHGAGGIVGNGTDARYRDVTSEVARVTVPTLTARECTLADITINLPIARAPRRGTPAEAVPKMRLFHGSSGAGDAFCGACPFVLVQLMDSTGNPTGIWVWQLRVTLVDFGSLTAPAVLLAYTRATFAVLMRGVESLVLRFIFTHHDKDHYNQAAKLVANLKEDHGAKVEVDTSMLVGGSTDTWKGTIDLGEGVEFVDLNDGKACHGTEECLEGTKIEQASFTNWCDPEFKKTDVQFHIERANIGKEKNEGSVVIVLTINQGDGNPPYVQRIAGDSAQHPRDKMTLDKVFSEAILEKWSDVKTLPKVPAAKRRNKLEGLDGDSFTLKDTVFQPTHHGSPFLEDSITSKMDLSATLAIVLSAPRVQNSLNHFHPSCATIATVAQRITAQRGVAQWDGTVATGGAGAG